MKLKRIAAGLVAAVMALAVMGTPLGDILPFVRESVATILSLAEKDGAPFLSQSEETCTNNIKWMLDTGVITKSVDTKDMIVKNSLADILTCNSFGGILTVMSAFLNVEMLL